MIAGLYEDAGPDSPLSAHVNLLLASRITSLDNFQAAGSIKAGVIHPNSCLNGCISRPNDRMAIEAFLREHGRLWSDREQHNQVVRQAAQARQLERSLGKHPCTKSDCEAAAEELTKTIGGNVLKDEYGAPIIDMGDEESHRAAEAAISRLMERARERSMSLIPQPANGEWRQARPVAGWR